MDNCNQGATLSEEPCVASTAGVVIFNHILNPSNSRNYNDRTKTEIWSEPSISKKVVEPSRSRFENAVTSVSKVTGGDRLKEHISVNHRTKNAVKADVLQVTGRLKDSLLFTTVVPSYLISTGVVKDLSMSNSFHRSTPGCRSFLPPVISHTVKKPSSICVTKGDLMIVTTAPKATVPREVNHDL